MNTVKDKTGTTTVNPIPIAASLTNADHFGAILCRLNNNFRMKYQVSPGLYALGNPTGESPVLVTANYKLSFNAVRSYLQNINAWILVIDTCGINVWCAAGKGSFCTKSIVKQIEASDLLSKVSHRIIILPQLGASGVSAQKLFKESGFKVKYGPVRASDIPLYLENNYTATFEMRTVQFSIVDRIKLVPMEVIPAFKKLLIVTLITAFFFGLTKTGIIYKNAYVGVLPIFIGGIVSVISGSILTPVLLPFIPFKAFTIKGLIMGILGSVFLLTGSSMFRNDPYLLTLSVIAIPAFSSYLAFLFTGSTTYTSPSGVKKELKAAWPVYITASAISFILLIIILIKHWGIL
jgi:hypothetical protein